MCAKWRPSQLPLMVSGPPLVIRPDQGHLSIFQRRETTYVSPQSEAQRPVFPPSRARKSDRFYRQPPTYALTPLCLLGFPGCRCALAGSITLMRVDPDAGSPTILLRPALAHLAYRHRFSPASHSARPAWTSLRLHAAVTKRLRKALAPDLKVRLSGIEPRSIRTQRSHRQMHVRMTALVMQGEHIRKPRPERLRCKGSRRIVQPHRICAPWHTQHDRAGKRPIPPTARLQHCLHRPVRCEHPHSHPPLEPLAVRTLKVQAAVAAGVIEVPHQMIPIARAAGDLDHHLRGAPDDPRELRIGGRVAGPSGRPQHRLGDPSPANVNGRAQRLLESERPAEFGHGSADQ